MIRKLHLVIVTTCLLTCGPAMADNHTLQFAYTFENHSIGQLIDEFAAQTNTEIERRFIQQADLKILLLETIETGTAPDVVLVPSDHTGLYRPMRFSAIDPSSFESNINSENWQTATVDGQIYGAPIIRGNHLMLFYNRSLVNEPASTWAEMQSQATQLATLGVKTIAWNYHEMYFFIPFLGAFDGWPITDGKLTLNSQAMVSALETYRDIAESGLINTECDYDCALDAFKSGELAYTINGDWALKEFQEALGDNLGIAVLPAWNQKKLVPMFSTHVVVFPGHSLESSDRQTKMSLIRYLQSYAVQKRLWEEIKVFPIEEQAYQEAVDNIEPELRAILTQLTQARAMPSERAMSYAWGAMAKGFSRFINDVITAEEAAELMQKLAERELAKDN